MDEYFKSIASKGKDFACIRIYFECEKHKDVSCDENFGMIYCNLDRTVHRHNYDMFIIGSEYIYNICSKYIFNGLEVKIKREKTFTAEWFDIIVNF